MKNLLILICVTLATTGLATAQSLSGVVKDIDGALIADGYLQATNDATGESFSSHSDERGEFEFSQLVPGKYQLLVTKVGFSTNTQSVIFPAVSFLEIVLEPGKVAEVVSISASYLAGSSEALNRMSGSIQTIGKNELESARVSNFAEALRKVSGVNIRNEEGFGLRPNISIRGSSPTRSRKVLLLEDGMPLSYAPYGDNSSYYHPPIERFESVEVLKGSGQIEYGPVTIAGVVNYITPNPTEDSIFSLKLTGGNRDYFNGSAGYSGTFGKTGVLFNFTRKQGEGSRENLRAGVNDLSTKLVRTLNDSNVITLKYSHFDESSQLTYSGLTEAEYAANPRQNPFINDDLESFREGFSASHSGVLFERTSVTTNFYTTYFSRDWWRQASNSTQRPNRLKSDPDCLSIDDLSTTCGNQGTPRDFRTFGVEPRLKMQFDLEEIKNEFDVGFRVHYETQNRRKFNGFSPNAREEGSNITERNLRNSLAASVFVQNRFIWKDFSITPGLRFERVNYERANLLNNTSAKTDLTQIIPGVGAAYNPSDTTTIFAGVHRGFAPPRTSDILTNSGGVVDLDSELSWNYELGVRSRPLDSLMIEATFFRNDYKNQIVALSVAGGVGSTQTNAGETLHQGFEISSRFDLNKVLKNDYNIYFQTAYTYVGMAEFQSVRFSSISGFGDVLITGNRLPYAPKHIATSSLGFVYKNFEGFVENNYIGKQFTDDLNTIIPISSGQRGLIGSQTYFNTTVNYRVEKWNSNFFVTAKNVFERLYIVDRTRGIYPSSPRLIQFGWKINFWK